MLEERIMADDDSTKCLHCKRRKAVKKWHRGLCHACYNDPKIRTTYPGIRREPNVKCKHCEQRKGNRYFRWLCQQCYNDPKIRALYPKSGCMAKPCAWPKCARITEGLSGGEKYCNEHKKESRRQNGYRQMHRYRRTQKYKELERRRRQYRQTHRNDDYQRRYRQTPKGKEVRRKSKAKTAKQNAHAKIVNVFDLIATIREEIRMSEAATHNDKNLLERTIAEVEGVNPDELLATLERSWIEMKKHVIIIAAVVYELRRQGYESRIKKLDFYREFIDIARQVLHPDLFNIFMGSKKLIAVKGLDMDEQAKVASGEPVLLLKIDEDNGKAFTEEVDPTDPKLAVKDVEQIYKGAKTARTPQQQMDTPQFQERVAKLTPPKPNPEEVEVIRLTDSGQVEIVCVGKGVMMLLDMSEAKKLYAGLGELVKKRRR